MLEPQYFSSLQLVSYADMILHDCPAFYDVCYLLSERVSLLSQVKPPREVSAAELEQVLPIVKSVKSLIVSLGISDPTFKADVHNILCDVEVAADEHESYLVHLTTDRLAYDLERLQRGIRLELQRRYFVYVAPPNDQFLEKKALFGPAVYEKFPSARADIKDAGNALAVELYTACVFHLMRVSEHGLRALARKLRATITHKGKQCPIEFGDWDKVITAVKGKVATARQLSPGPKRQAKLEAYSNAADHCEYMKDIWRNNTSHTRKPYNEAETIGVLERVRDFMQFLGKSL